MADGNGSIYLWLPSCIFAGIVVRPEFRADVEFMQWVAFQ